MFAGTDEGTSRTSRTSQVVEQSACGAVVTGHPSKCREP
jgi:hypothetical protein